ncbi:MAG TPA: hypothetical protein VF463_08200 [Sphingobium sp.]
MSWHVAGDWDTTRLRLFRLTDGAMVERNMIDDRKSRGSPICS